MKIRLKKLNESTNTYEMIGSFITNNDGRLEGGPALKGEAFLTASMNGRLMWATTLRQRACRLRGRHS